jgi:hypothetical protein
MNEKRREEIAQEIAREQVREAKQRIAEDDAISCVITHAQEHLASATRQLTAEMRRLRGDS